MLKKFNRSIVLVLVGLLAVACSNVDDGPRNAGTPTAIPPGPLGPSNHVDNQCPQNIIGRFRNQDPTARPSDRFVTVFRDPRNQLVLSLSARPRLDRSTDLPINGTRTAYGEKAHATAFCEKGQIKIFSFSSDGQWFATLISQTSPATLQIRVTHQGQILRDMNFSRRGQDSRDENPDETRDENERDPIDGNDPIPPYDEEEDFEEPLPGAPRPGLPRPRPPVVPPRKEVPPIVKPPRQQPPKKEVPPPTKPPVVVTPPVAPPVIKPPVVVPPVVNPPVVNPPVVKPPVIKPPIVQPPTQAEEFDDLGCPFLTGSFKLQGQDQRMNIKTLSFKRDDQKILIAGTASQKESFPDIALNGKNLPDGKGGEVSGECIKGLVLLKATTYSNTKLRLEIRKISTNELELKNFVNEKLTKSYKYSRKND